MIDQRTGVQKSERLFFIGKFDIYYDKCIEDELNRIARDYEGFNVRFELDEHYCCHKCNPDYCM